MAMGIEPPVYCKNINEMWAMSHSDEAASVFGKTCYEWALKHLVNIGLNVSKLNIDLENFKRISNHLIGSNEQSKVTCSIL